MKKVTIRTMVDEVDLDKIPKISGKVSEYIWQYIYDNLLVKKKIMTDDKYQYQLTFNLKKLDPEIHKYFSNSPYNTDINKFLPESKFNTDGNWKFALLSVTSKDMTSDISVENYANIIYDAFGSFLILLSKKITKQELDELKSGLDYHYINSFSSPAPLEECNFFIPRILKS